jgi:hypothetical protein
MELHPGFRKKNSRASYILVLRSDRKQEKGEIVDD